MTHVIWGWLTPDKVIAISTMIYAFVTIVMFFSIRSQAKASHRQADVAYTAAKAAKQSADALIATERPWILVTIEPFPAPTAPHYSDGRWYNPNGSLVSVEDVLGNKAKARLNCPTLLRTTEDRQDG